MKSVRGTSFTKTLLRVLCPVLLLLTGLFVQTGCRNNPSPGQSNAVEVIVANMGAHNVMVFELTANGTLPDTPVRVIRGPATGLHNPFDVAVDGLNRIWVANLGDPPGSNPSITVYEPGVNGNIAPSFTFSLSVRGQFALPGSLTKFSAEAMLMTSAIAEGGFSRSGNTIPFFTMMQPTIDTTAQFFGSPFNGSPELVNPTGVAFRSDTIYVAVSSLPLITGLYGLPSSPASVILKFGRTQNGFNRSPDFMISGNNTGLSNPAHIEFDQAGNLFVLNRGTPGSSADLPGITVYGPGQSGNIAPVRIIRGQRTGLVTPGNPYGIAVTKNGRIFVSNQNSILVFEPGANGNAEPFDILENTASSSSRNTDLSSPVGIAIKEN